MRVKPLIAVFKTGVVWMKALIKCLMWCQRVLEEWRINQAANKDAVMLTWECLYSSEDSLFHSLSDLMSVLLILNDC